MLLIIIAISSSLSQDLLGVWHRNVKAPVNKENVFILSADEEPTICNTAFPNNNVGAVKTKSTSQKTR